MATWTATELATQVLKELGIVGSGQTASDEDLSRVLIEYTSVYPQLRRKRLAQWAKATISESAQVPLARYLAGRLAGQFGFVGPDKQLKEIAGESGYIELQEVAEGDQHNSDPPFDDF